jgi:hypothetical protein
MRYKINIASRNTYYSIGTRKQTSCRAHPRAVIFTRVVGWILPRKVGGRLDIMKREGGKLDVRKFLGGRLDICHKFKYDVIMVTRL